MSASLGMGFRVVARGMRLACIVAGLTCGAPLISAAAAEPAAAAAVSSTPVNRITVLYDAFGRDERLTKDWGFSALVETGGRRILFDTGNDAEILEHNVGASDVDLRNLDFAVVSHRHGDHMGGLNYLLRVNPQVRIFVPHENFGVFGASLPGSFYPRDESLPRDMRYFDGHPPETLQFGTPWHGAKFSPVRESTEIAPGVHLLLLKGTWGVDLDVMELSLAIDTPDGTVIVVGCAHPTIERIVAAARSAIDAPIHLVIGGLHLLPAGDDETRRIAHELHDVWQVERIAPAHCTGERGFSALRQTFAERYVYAGLGTTIPIGTR